MGLKGGISIDADSGPLGYVLWCCGSRSQDFFTFIQISSGHTVCPIYWENGSVKICTLQASSKIQEFKLNLFSLYTYLPNKYIIAYLVFIEHTKVHTCICRSNWGYLCKPFWYPPESLYVGARIKIGLNNFLYKGQVKSE